MDTSSENFNFPDADITIRSQDKVLFRIHRKNLETNTGAFPPAEFESRDEIVELSEQSSTLELLFQFIYPRRHPDLIDVTYEVLAPLAEAAEKYEVFPAMNICHIRMVNFKTAQAEGIMTYAAKHGYHKLVDEVAPLVVSKPIGTVVHLLPPHLIVPWVVYRQQWYDILCGSFATLNFGYCSNCGYQSRVSGFVLQGLTVATLSELSTLIQNAKVSYNCYECNPRLDTWHTETQGKVNGIQKFSSFV